MKVMMVKEVMTGDVSPVTTFGTMVLFFSKQDASQSGCQVGISGTSCNGIILCKLQPKGGNYSTTEDQQQSGVIRMDFH